MYDSDIARWNVAEPLAGGYQRPHQNLDVWKLAIDVVVSVYECTALFPKEELYTLTAQMRRAAISVPSNIAEGAARRSRNEFHRFCNISAGSASELDTQLIVAARLGYITLEDPIFEQLHRVSALLGGLIRSLKNS